MLSTLGEKDIFKDLLEEIILFFWYYSEIELLVYLYTCKMSFLF